MISKIKKPVSILLVFMMIVSLFAMVPVTASAAEYYGAYDAYDSNSINELKQGDQISGHYDPTETEYLEADYVTIVDYNTGDKIASRVLEWTADKDYEIKQKAQNDISGDFEDSFDSAFVYEYVFTVSEAKPKYTVTWKNGDTVLKTDTVEEGATPTYTGETPEKAEDENYTYTFAGWSPEITAVTGDVTYTAQFDATEKSAGATASETLDLGPHNNGVKNRRRAVGFTTDHFSVQPNPANGLIARTDGWTLDGEYSDEMFITISALNGETITSIVVNRGANDTNSPLLKADGNIIEYTQSENTFTFENVNATEVKIYGNPSFDDSAYCLVNSITVNYNGGAPTGYTVTWKNGDTVLETDENVAEGTTPEYNGTTPEKAEDENNTYTFAGWTPAVAPVTADVTYTATFTATPLVIKDCIYTLPQSAVVLHANVPIVKNSIDGEFNMGDLPNGTIAAADVSTGGSIALYDAKRYIYKFYDQAGTEIPLTIYGSSSFPGSDVNIPGDVTVYFKHYTGLPESCKDVYIVATIPTTYTVTWQNEDGTTLKTDTVDEGDTPSYTGSDPTKASDDYHSYSFKGWDPEVTAVTGDVTYTAQYDTTTNHFNVYIRTYTGKSLSVDVTGDTTVAQLKEMAVEEFGIPAAEQRLLYSGSEIENAKTLADYGIKNNSSVNIEGKKYTITWKNDDDSVIDTTSVSYGTVPTHDDAVKAGSAGTVYIFTGWTPEVVAVTGDATYTATFTASVLPEVIKGCTYQFYDFKVYSNVPFVEEPDDYSDGAISGYIPFPGSVAAINDTKGYSYKLYDQTGTELTIDSIDSSSESGSNYGFSDDVTYYYNTINYTAPTGITALYIVATAPAAPAVDLFPQHSITLGGNIGVNFYIDSAAADFANASTAVVKFTWDGGGEDRTKEVNLKELTPDADGYYKATVDVVAAHMAHEIHAEVYLNGKKLDQTDDYSVQDYAETVYANPEKYDSEKPDELKALAKALLNYGAMAQTVFYNSLKEHPDLANTTVGYNGYEGVTADQIEGAINGEASDLNAVAAQLGAKYYTNSLIYLSKNTLRIYFTPTSYPGEIPNAGAYDGNLSGYYYYVDHADIPAAELDNQQTFNVNGTEFTFSALDYAKAVVESTKMEPEQQNLAKALYLYNQAANAYFDDEEPAPHTHDFTYAADGATITATCNGAGTCDIDEGLSLTISAPTGELTANGTTTFPATLSTGYNTTAFPDTYTISYTKDGQPFDGTPTEAGAYTASVTVGTATASVSYAVAAPVVNYTYWVGPYAQYEHSLLLSVGTELHTGDLIAWEGSGWNQYQVLDSSNNNNQIAYFEECDGWSVTGNYRVTGLTRCFDTDCDCLIYLEPIANN